MKSIPSITAEQDSGSARFQHLNREWSNRITEVYWWVLTDLWWESIRNLLS